MILLFVIFACVGLGLSASGQVTAVARLGPGVPFTQAFVTPAPPTPHNHPSSLLLFETFEGTGYSTVGWVETIGGGGIVDEDYTTTVLDGAQSLFIDGPSDEVSYTIKTFTPQSIAYAYFQFRITSVNQPLEDEWLSLFRLRDAAGFTVLKMQVDYSFFPRIVTGGVAAGTLSNIAIDTTYHAWLSWNKNDGANSTATMAISTSKVQPTSGDYYVTVTTGTVIAEDASQAFLGYANDTVDDPGPEMSTIYDYVMIDDVAVPDYP